MTESSKTREHVEPEEPHEPIDEREEMNYLAELILEAEDLTPEEAGYGHGV